MFVTDLTVRGYELDSYGHVNNAVYLQYLEQARWEIIRKLNGLEYLQRQGFSLVVSEIKIRYMRESKLFDVLVIESDLKVEAPYIVFYQKIRNRKNRLLVSKATVKTVLINQNKIPQDIPQLFNQTQH